MPNLFKNIWYKVAALTLAVVIWGIVQGEEILEVNHHVYLTVNLPPNLIMQGEQQRRKDVTLRGPRVLLGEITSRPLRGTIEIPEGTIGTRRILVGPEHIRDWDSRLQITIHNPYLEVTVDEPLEREVPVREVLQGAPAPGYLLEKVSVSPKTILIRGLRSEIVRIREVLTEPIDITGIRQSREVEVPVVLNNSSVEWKEPSVVSVSLQLGDSRINRRYTEIPIETIGSEFLAEVEPQTVTIELQGTPGTLNYVKRSDMRAFVDIANTEPGEVQRDIQVKIPPETVLIETFPDKAEVKVLSQRRLN